MAVVSVVKLSELEGAKRLDAEYYQPEYLEVERLITRGSFTHLGNLMTEIIHPKEIKREYEEEKKDYLFLLAQNVRPLMLDLSEKKYISEKTAELLSRNLLEYGDILFIRTGAVGVVTAYAGYPEKVYASAHILIGKPNFTVSPFYLAVFLNTKFGKSLIIRGTYGAVQPEISPEYLKKIPIPLLNNEVVSEVENLFLKAQNLLKESEIIYSQAESILLSELGLQGFEPEDKIFYEVNLSTVNTSHRIDAEYFNPKYDVIIEKIRNYKHGYGKLLNFAEYIKPNFEPRTYSQKIFPYIELADINRSIGLIQSSTIIKGEEAPNRARRILKKNDIIISRVEGSLEKVALVDEEFENSLASTGFFQFRSKNILPEVLLVLSKSPIIQSQLKKECAGTILTAVPQKSIVGLIIPILPEEIQWAITKFVTQSHETRKKAEKLLEKAKKIVEDAIE